ncbi:MAG: xanthine dehydrogenase family protein molybdopterin-binding subunit [Chloroflexi bacterium]|nr:xanthine dehydrogenase family protein molybdopterin-binding subunit [Chloroflexota bacterium]
MATVSERKKTRYIGKRTPKYDALERVTGQALFAADLHLPGMLHGKVLRSPHPHALIKRIDTRKAEALPGVKAVVTAADLPPPERAQGMLGGELLISIMDLRRLTIAHDKALFEGHAIAAVAATTPEVAEEALDLIQVDYEVLPPVENALEAMSPDAPLLQPDLYTKTLGEQPERPSNVATHSESSRGDLERGFAEADLVHETSYETKMVHQGYLEPTATVAHAQPDGRITLWTSTQGIFGIRRSLGHLLDLPLGKVNVIPTEIGGGFGGKIYAILEPLAALLSRKSGHPVKIVMSRAEVFRATGPASPTHITVKTGAKKDGRLTAAYVKLVMDAGAVPGAPIGGASLVCLAPYKLDHMKIEAYDVVTNKPRVQAYRAPGGTPAAFAVESHMDQVAERLGIDPLAFRMLNAVDEGDRMTDDRPYNRIGLKEVLRRVAKHPSWTSPLPPGPHRGRGLALGFWAGATLTSTAHVLVHADGTATLVSGQVDLTGTRTTMQQIVAEELQVPLESVSVRVGDTDSTPYTDLSAGSRTAYSFGAAVHNACQDVLAQLRVHAADHLTAQPEHVEYADGRFWLRDSPDQNVDLVTVARRSTFRATGPICGRGTVTRLQPAPQFAAHVADVEVDPDTGKVTILRYTAFQDVGRALNPTQVEGQVQGGAAQGIGWALTEYYHFEKGVMRNPTFLDYRMPTSLDLPMIDCELVEVPASDGPYGARGVGEVPIVPPAAALANAVYRAAGVRLHKLPMTPEEVFRARQATSAIG